MAGADIRVASGNFVTAQPVGVRDGIDYLHTGEVRNVDAGAINRALDGGAIVVLSPVGYSPTGEVFNLSAEDVATAAAAHLRADKLLYLVDGPGLLDADGKLIRELTPNEAEQVARQQELPRTIARCLTSAIAACRKGLRRAHLIDRHVDGSLLLELFTRDGIGTLITSEVYEGTRHATIADVGGILELIRPLEEEGVLVRRSRELLEMEIDHFVVSERDGTVIACSALYPYPEEKVGEVACMAVHADYRKQGRGDELLKYMERHARSLGIERLFVLTTRTAHWFQERGFVAGEITDLPVAKQLMYNYQRRSKVFIRALG
jgi:amino-acid N-acetyltransferase